MSDESDVLDCLLMYRSDAAKDILKKYDYDYNKIINKLKTYNGRAKYHGHGTQKPGYGVAGAAKTNQDAAITYLDDNAPPVSSGGSGGKKTSNKAKSDNM